MVLKAARAAQPFNTRVVALFHDLCISDDDIQLFKQLGSDVQQCMSTILNRYQDIQPATREVEKFVTEAMYEQFFKQLESEIPIAIIRIFYASILTHFSSRGVKIYDFINSRLNSFLPNEGEMVIEKIRSISLSILKI